jgi:hypothetical protein
MMTMIGPPSGRTSNNCRATCSFNTELGENSESYISIRFYSLFLVGILLSGNISVLTGRNLAMDMNIAFIGQ